MVEVGRSEEEEGFVPPDSAVGSSENLGQSSTVKPSKRIGPRYEEKEDVFSRAASETKKTRRALQTQEWKKHNGLTR